MLFLRLVNTHLIAANFELLIIYLPVTVAAWIRPSLNRSL